MKIDIYKSALCGDKYLAVGVGTKIETLVLPRDVDTDLLSLSPIKTRLEIDNTKPHPTLDVQYIAQNINTHGYAIHGVKSVITLKAK